jgi:hypothetical protein
MATADIMLHVDESLDEPGRERVKESLRELAGIANVRSTEHTPHLFVVEYDPSAVKSSDILHRVTGAGLHAELVGL